MWLVCFHTWLFACLLSDTWVSCRFCLQSLIGTHNRVYLHYPMHSITSYHCIHPNPFQGSQGLVMQVMVNQLSQQGAKRIYFPLDKVVRGYDPLDMVSFDSWRRFPQPRLFGKQNKVDDLSQGLWPTGYGEPLTLGRKALNKYEVSFNQATGSKC